MEEGRIPDRIESLLLLFFSSFVRSLACVHTLLLLLVIRVVSSVFNWKTTRPFARRSTQYALIGGGVSRHRQPHARQQHCSRPITTTTRLVPSANSSVPTFRCDDNSASTHEACRLQTIHTLLHNTLTTTAAAVYT